MEKDPIIKTDDYFLAYCLRLVEERSQLGTSESWSTQDFERLAELIAEKTGIRLSVTTLKRVWGRIRYDSSPTATTLGALAQFIGFSTWSQFRESIPAAIPPTPAAAFAEPALPAKPEKKSSRRIWRAGWAGLALVIGAALLLIGPASQKISPEDYTFSSVTISKGLPNSVLFRYNASASPTDSVFIQQSWDPRRRTPVPKDGREHSSIYYYPGYFLAKLVIGKDIVKEHDLLIPSEGWHVSVMQEPVPFYMKEQNVIKNGELHLPVSEVAALGIPMAPKPPSVRYRYVKDWENIRSDNFLLETRFRNTFSQGAAACQRLQLYILCKSDYFMIPLCNKGCVGDIGLYLSGHAADARQTDLSAFGTNMSEWVDFRCEVKNKLLRILINGKQAYQASIPNPPKDVIGLGFDFEGSGAVDFVSLKRPDGTTVFQDDFSDKTITSR